MKKLYSMIMMLAMTVAALGLTACGGGDDDDGFGGGVNGGNGGGSGNGGSSSATSLTIVKSSGEKYYSLGGYEWASGYNTNGSLTDESSIFCQLTYEKGISISYLYVNLKNGEKSVSDFPSGYDLGTPTVNFGKSLTSDNRYKYASGSIKVVSNNGKGFTLNFDNYKAERSSSSNIVINGTMYVEKEKIY